MLMRRRRRGERGQVLLAGLAIIAMFGLLAGAVLTFIGTAQTQHQLSDATAARNVLAEGGAQYAVAAVTSSTTGTCNGTASGTATNTSGSATDTLKYTVQFCEPNFSSSQPGGNCMLCVLNAGASALTISNGNAMVNVRGEIAINGGVSIQGNWQKSGGQYSWNGSTLCSSTAATATTCAGQPEFMGIGGDLNGSKGTWPPPSPLASGATLPFSPNPTVINTIADPLASLPAPTLGVVAIPVSLGTGTTTLSPGTYSGNMAIGGHQDVVLNAGTYVFTGNITLTGNGILDGHTGVTIFMACSTKVGSTTTSRACNSGEAGASLDVSGGGQYLLTAPSTGSYTNIAIFQDRNNTSQIKIGGSGTTNNLSGGVYAKSANVDIGGNGSDVFQANGRLVVSTLTIHVNASAGLSLIGSVISGPSCDLYDAAVTGTEVAGGKTTTRTGEVTFAAGVQCTGRGVVSFTYTP